MPLWRLSRWQYARYHHDLVARAGRTQMARRWSFADKVLPDRISDIGQVIDSIAGRGGDRAAIAAILPMIEGLVPLQPAETLTALRTLSRLAPSYRIDGSYRNRMEEWEIMLPSLLYARRMASRGESAPEDFLSAYDGDWRRFARQMVQRQDLAGNDLVAALVETLNRQLGVSSGGQGAGSVDSNDAVLSMFRDVDFEPRATDAATVDAMIARDLKRRDEDP